MLFFGFGEGDGKGCAFSGSAFHTDAGMMDQRRMLDDGKAEPRSADLLGAAFIDPIEPFKDAVQTFRATST